MGTIQVESLNFKYRVKEVLKAIQLEMKPGQFIGILGPNGSGKTTLIKNICGVLIPTSGRVAVDEKTVENYGKKNLAKRVAVVHQGGVADFDFKVEEVVLMGRYAQLGRFQSEGKEDYEAAERAMKLTGTEGLRTRSIKAVSGGERQRVLIARALAQETDVLLLDEPISHLDIKHQMEILALCKRLAVDEGMTVIASLHDINMAARFCSEIVLMKSGEIVAVGEPKTVLTKERMRDVYDIDVNVMGQEVPIIVPV
ncbi:MAG: cobalamin transport system ATP-binding protein [Clostridiales bacterium]|jgi:iron complex transport system ATP-binding protein|nr:cobalamin transport system ATP-binding protein [Clostridiales bacterium]